LFGEGHYHTLCGIGFYTVGLVVVISEEYLLTSGYIILSLWCLFI